jgi:hypothetical protein
MWTTNDTTPNPWIMSCDKGEDNAHGEFHSIDLRERLRTDADTAERNGNRVAGYAGTLSLSGTGGIPPETAGKLSAGAGRLQVQ